MNKNLILLDTNDIDTRLFQLAHWHGFTTKDNAYKHIPKLNIKKPCRVQYVERKFCWAIVCMK